MFGVKKTVVFSASAFDWLYFLECNIIFMSSLEVTTAAEKPILESSHFLRFIPESVSIFQLDHRKYSTPSSRWRFTIKPINTNGAFRHLSGGTLYRPVKLVHVAIYGLPLSRRRGVVDIFILTRTCDTRPLYCLLLTTGVLLLLPFLVYGLSPGQEVDGDWQQRYRSIVSSRTSRTFTFCLSPVSASNTALLGSRQSCFRRLAWQSASWWTTCVQGKGVWSYTCSGEWARDLIQLLIQSEVVLLSCSADFITLILLQRSTRNSSDFS